MPVILMKVNHLIFKELMKRGHSVNGENNIWDLSDSKLWYLTPELSEGFLNLAKYEPYKNNVIDREIDLLYTHFHKIVSMVPGEKFNLVDLGCGDGSKAVVIAKNIPEYKSVRYCPVDISQHFISAATTRIRNLNLPHFAENRAFVSDFEHVDDIIALIRNPEYQHHVVLLLGETLSHFDVHDLLYKISNGMFDQDILVIGNGIRTAEGEKFVDLDKYRDPLFHQWFVHVMKGLGFDEDEVEYDVRFNNDRLEGFYKIKRSKHIEHNGKKVEFKPGDEVVVAIQYKYFEDEIVNFCNMYFCSVEVMKDPEGYALIVCKK